MYILVAELPDKPSSLEQMLLTLGHDVTSCQDADDLLAQCQYNVYQVIMVDVNIWHSTLYQDIRASLGGQDAMIVAAGPPDQAEKILTAIETGAEDYLLTPVSETLLKTRFALLQRELPSHQHVDEEFSQLRKAIETMQLGVLVTDLEGLITYVNPALAAMHGYDDEELLGQPIGMLKAPDIPTFKKVARWQGMIREGIHVRQDGSTFPIWMTTEIVQNADGEPHAIVNTVEDITERKEMESALEQERALLAQRVEERTADLKQANEELEIAAKLKDEFLESMTYELRNPLKVIIQLTEALQEGIYGKLFGNLLNAITNIEKSGRSLLAIINDILDITKIRTDVLNLNMTDVPVRSLCRFSMRTIRPSAEKKNVKISAGVDKHVNTIRTEAVRFQQILIHMLDNAVKFTPNGGEVTLRVKGDNNMGLVHVAVSDTGFGIEEEDIGRLFAPFTQADETISRIYGGTGLGLSLIYHIVDLHHGCITVESEPDKGCHFTMTLPWHQEPDAEWTFHVPEIKEPQKQETNQAAPLIVMADPNPIHLYVVADYLAEHGCRVLLAQDGEKTLEFVKEQQPDLLFLDINIPLIHGIEIIHRLRNHADTASLPILATTSIIAEEEHTRCLDAGANDYLSKPFNLNVLDRRIKSLLHKENA